MKIAVVNNWVPFLKGGAEVLADELVGQLKRRGHQVQLFRVPMRWNSDKAVYESMLSARLLNIPLTDRVICLKFPTYYVEHPNKVVWLLHQFRQVYDLWGTPYQGYPDGPIGQTLKDTITRMDVKHLTDAMGLYTISPVVTDRLKKFCGLDSSVLFHPLSEEESYVGRSYEPFIFCPGRISAGKRQHLLIEAAKHLKARGKIVVAGPPDTPEDLARVQQAIKDHGVEDRVELHPKFIDHQAKVDFYATCRGVAYIPYDEDSYGYVTLEAMTCQKPVLTCSDSGGTHILVRDRATGSVVPPDAQSLAATMDAWLNDETAARGLGRAAHAQIKDLGIGWDRVVEKLTT